jgi:hypothetical protein
MQPLATHLLFRWSGILGSDGLVRASRSFPDSFEPKPCPLHFGYIDWVYKKKEIKNPQADLRVNVSSFNHSLATYGEVHKNRSFIYFLATKNGYKDK